MKLDEIVSAGSVAGGEKRLCAQDLCLAVGEKLGCVGNREAQKSMLRSVPTVSYPSSQVIVQATMGRDHSPSIHPPSGW